MASRKSTVTSADTVTMLMATGGRLATKQIIKNTSNGNVEMINFEAGMWYGVLPRYPVDDIFALSTLLSALEGLPNFLIIRGEPVDPVMADTYLMRRLGSGEGEYFNGNFRTPEQGRCYILIDVDKLELPPWLTLVQSNVEAVCEHVIGLLPSEFHDVSYHWQLSSSAGFGDPSQVSLHLWFWLDEPVSDASLRRWGEFVNTRAGIKLVDINLFQHVQAHYTAAPIFEGVKNPFPTRSGLTAKGKQSVAIVLPPVAQPSLTTTSQAPSSAGRVVTSSGYDAIVASIGDHPGGEGFRKPLLRAAASFVRSNGSANTDPEALYEALRSAVLAADSSSHTREEVEERASRQTIMPMIRTAMGKFGQQATHLPHLIQGVAPAAASEPVLARHDLVERVREFFDF